MGVPGIKHRDCPLVSLWIRLIGIIIWRSQRGRGRGGLWANQSNLSWPMTIWSFILRNKINYRWCKYSRGQLKAVLVARFIHMCMIECNPLSPSIAVSEVACFSNYNVGFLLPWRSTVKWTFAAFSYLWPINHSTCRNKNNANAVS